MNDFFIGGGQRLVLDILKQPVFDEDNIHLITFVRDEKREELLRELPSYIMYHRIDFPHILSIKGWWKLYRLLRKIKPDIVWAHFYFSNTVFRIVGLFLGYPTVIVEHNTYVWKSWLQRTVDRILSKSTYRIVAVSNTVADFTSEQEHIPRDKFLVIPNGVDLRRLAAETEGLSKDDAVRILGLPTGYKYVINVARLSSQKNHRLLIESFAIFAKKYTEYALIIVGEGPEQEVLERLVQAKDLGGRVHFLGSRMDVGVCYLASDFFVLTSKIEGFALVCIEAMSFGLPVVSTRVAGPDTYIIDAENGYLAASEPTELAEKMTLVVSGDQQSLRAMRETARETAQIYDIERTVESYNILFSSILSKSVR